MRKNLLAVAVVILLSIITTASFAAPLQIATGLAWLGTQLDSPTDYLSRQIIAYSRTGQDTSAHVASLLLYRNSDGGWGGEPGYLNDVLDTALALQAFAVQCSEFRKQSLRQPSHQTKSRRRVRFQRVHYLRNGIILYIINRIRPSQYPAAPKRDQLSCHCSINHQRPLE